MEQHDEHSPITKPEAASERPLADFLPEGPAPHPVVTLVSTNREVVIIGSPGPGQVKVFGLPDAVFGIAEHVLATAISDPQRVTALLSESVAALAAKRESAAAERDQAMRDHERQLSEIRSYAVARHRSGEICREGLNKFLAHFDLDEYQPRTRVKFTITGSYVVDNDDTSSAAYDARNYLRVDFDDIDGLSDDTDTYAVTVDDTETIDDDD